MQLKNYQIQGVKSLLKQPHNILADEMGLGKTAQALVYAEESKSNNILIICPAHLKLNWERECKIWLKTPYTVQVVNKSKDVLSTIENDKLGIKLLIINYDLIIKPLILTQVKRMKYDLIILDEAHYLKSPKSKRTKVILGTTINPMIHNKSVIDLAPRKLALTGTPIPNRPIELYPILASFLPHIFNKGYWWFARRYANARQTHWGWDVTGSSNLPELRQILKTHLVTKRTKAGVLKELPSKIKQVILFEPDKETKKILKKESQYDLKELKQAISEGKTPINFEEMSTIRREMGVSKVPLVIKHIKSILDDTEQKIVIFAWHKSVIQSLKDMLSDYNPVLLTGEMSHKVKQLSVDKFQTDSSVKVFIGNIKAAGTGITLTAASTVVFVELDWVPGNITQAEDRCHRIGQTDSVLVQHLVVKGSIDSYLVEAIIKKQKVIERILK